VLADYFPDIHVIVPTGEGTQVVPMPRQFAQAAVTATAAL